jgi:hypothetical protein
VSKLSNVERDRDQERGGIGRWSNKRGCLWTSLDTGPSLESIAVKRVLLFDPSCKYSSRSYRGLDNYRVGKLFPAIDGTTRH